MDDVPVTSDLRDEILGYVGDFYSRKKRAPSVRAITKKFAMSNRQFYALFQSVRDLCKEADVPINERAFERVAEATRTRTGRIETAGDAGRRQLPPEENEGPIFDVEYPERSDEAVPIYLTYAEPQSMQSPLEEDPLAEAIKNVETWREQWRRLDELKAQLKQESQPPRIDPSPHRNPRPKGQNASPSVAMGEVPLPARITQSQGVEAAFHTESRHAPRYSGPLKECPLPDPVRDGKVGLEVPLPRPNSISTETKFGLRIVSYPKKDGITP